MPTSGVAKSCGDTEVNCGLATAEDPDDDAYRFRHTRPADAGWKTTNP
jgi:hypothetical protein